MKNIKHLIAVGLLTIANGVIAQDSDMDNREKFQFGLKAGTNYSNVYDERTEEFDADAKFGFAGGAFVRIPIGKYFGVQPEVLFSQKGFKGKGVLFGGAYSFTRTTNYIDIPLQIAIKPADFITIVAGPQYSYLVKQTDEFESTLLSYSQEQEFENDNIRKNIFGVVGGVDVNIDHFVVGARMGWDIQNNNGDGTSNTPRYKNVWFQATVGYAIF
jgi:hypothetical protein